MPIPPHVAEAAERLELVDSGKSVKEVYGVPWRSMEYDHPYHADLRRVLGLALSLITSQQAEAAERGKALTEEKLIAFGFEREDNETLRIRWEKFSYKNELVIALKVGFAAVTQILRNSDDDFDDDPDCCVQIPCPTTRGELLDLLAGLKIQVKGTDHAKA